MADNVVKQGDLSGCVDVEVTRARVGVNKLVKVLIANAGAEFASTYYYYTILRMHLAGHEDYKEVCEGRTARGPRAPGVDSLHFAHPHALAKHYARPSPPIGPARPLFLSWCSHLP